jgi:peptide chain release factor 3
MKISLYTKHAVKPDEKKIMNSKNLNVFLLARTNMDNYFLADSDFTIQMTQNKYPSVKLFLLQNL